MKEKPAENVPA